MSDLRNKFELICGQCPLAECDENSLWCAYRFATKPNAAQQAAIGLSSRKPYYQQYYANNRDTKLKAANERNAKERESRLAISTSHKG